MERNFIYATCPQCTGTAFLIIDLNEKLRIATFYRLFRSRKPTLAMYCSNCDATYPLPDEIEIERIIDQTHQEAPELKEGDL